MKNILVSTDFSANAHSAAIYAADLAQQTRARLILVHTYALPNPDQELKEENEMEFIAERQLQAQMDRLTLELHQLFNISITRLLKPNAAPNEILAISEQVKADVVIIANKNGIELPKSSTAIADGIRAKVGMTNLITNIS